jgi:hypothetical protein
MHFTSCKKAAEICNKAQYEEATKWEIFRMKFHHLFCKFCAKHSKDNTALTDLCSKADLKALTDSEKTKMKEVIDKQL